MNKLLMLLAVFLAGCVASPVKDASKNYDAKRASLEMQYFAAKLDLNNIASSYGEDPENIKREAGFQLHKFCLSGIKNRGTLHVIELAEKLRPEIAEPFLNCKTSFEAQKASIATETKWLSNSYREVVELIEAKPESKVNVVNDALSFIAEAIKYQSIKDYPKPITPKNLPGSFNLEAFNLCGPKVAAIPLDGGKIPATKNIIQREITGSGLTIDECVSAGVAAHIRHPGLFLPIVEMLSFMSELSESAWYMKPHDGAYLKDSRYRANEIGSEYRVGLSGGYGTPVSLFPSSDLIDDGSLKTNYELMFSRSRPCEIKNLSKVTKEYHRKITSEYKLDGGGSPAGYSKFGVGVSGKQMESSGSAGISTEGGLATQISDQRFQYYGTAGCTSDLSALTMWRPTGFIEYAANVRQLEKFATSDTEKNCIDSNIEIYSLKKEEAALKCYRNGLKSDTYKKQNLPEMERRSRVFVQSGVAPDIIYMLGIRAALAGSI